MSGPLFLGLDIGHTDVKAAVHDEAGTVVSTACLRAANHTPHPHWHERDMHELWMTCAAVLRDAVAAIPADGRRIAAVGITGHGDGLHLVDEACRPIRPAILATDTRAQPVADRLSSGPAGLAALRWTGQVPAAYSQASLLNWLREYEPEALQRARWSLYCKDWIRYQLTGVIATDPSDASAAFLDLETGTYTTRVLDLYGLSELEHLLPPVQAGTDLAGVISPDAASVTGLPAGTPVATGAHDVHACTLGIGATLPGAAAAVTGTFTVNTMACGRPRTDRSWQARRSPIFGRWLHMSTSPTGSANLAWLLREGSRTPRPQGRRSLSRSMRRALETTSGRPCPLFLPFLHGSPLPGRPPGALIGLEAWHTHDHLLAAAIRGITFTHRWHQDTLAGQLGTPDTVTLSGSAAALDPWARLFADTLNRTITVTPADQAGCRGAALLAADATGYGTASWQPARTPLEPHPPTAAAMEVEYQQWLQIAQVVADHWENS